ncbi:unnamed protein product [Amoebophrya sp. A25]|nr:unnamed protein product [Amoebophrya sp. A25]|eukprot:GSA25T00022484001.1
MSVLFGRGGPQHGGGQNRNVRLGKAAARHQHRGGGSSSIRVVRKPDLLEAYQVVQGRSPAEQERLRRLMPPPRLRKQDLDHLLVGPRLRRRLMLARNGDEVSESEYTSSVGGGSERMPNYTSRGDQARGRTTGRTVRGGTGLQTRGAQKSGSRTHGGQEGGDKNLSSFYGSAGTVELENLSPESKQDYALQLLLKETRKINHDCHRSRLQKNQAEPQHFLHLLSSGWLGHDIRRVAALVVHRLRLLRANEQQGTAVACCAARARVRYEEYLAGNLGGDYVLSQLLSDLKSLNMLPNPPG